ncbi:MAG: carboxypeptidase regulatory-like domain-containing protein, partial [Anaerolineae bacterium]|nr:carboxypeptidase regulatory-like domain-containing protein [Anaerolineae bacterium]
MYKRQYYIFNNLAAGTYRVDVDESTLPTNYALTSNNEPMTVTLTTGQKFLAADFGYWLRGTGSIGDRVFYDLDGSGLPDGGTEPGINGVKVNLHTGTCAARTGLWSSQITAGNGNYSFTQLPAGTYCVDVDESTLPAGLALTTANEPRTVNLADGQNFTTADFGYRPVCPSGTPNLATTVGVLDDTGSALPTQQGLACVDIEPRPGAIGDYVWYDANGNGIEDVAEPGIANVTLRLYRDNGNGVFDLLADTVVATTTTDADGGYLFAGLPAGTYFVRVTDAYGVLVGLTHIVGGQSKPSPTTAIVLGPGQVYKDADFGYYRALGPGQALIGDTVWYDANGDGFQQPGEPGIPGVTIVVTDSTGTRLGSAVTDSNGHYSIIVPAGADYTAGPDLAVPATAAALAGLTATTPTPAAIPPLAGGQQYLAADFGYRDDGTRLGTIGNLVFYDANKNGVFDGADTPLGGVSVALIRDSNGNGAWDAGEPIIATVTTATTVDANTGNYLFTGVPAGKYLVHVSDTNAVLTDYERGPLGAAGVNNNSQADPYGVTLAAGGANLTADFGYIRANRPDSGVIGNQVWLEEDGDGLFDPANRDLGVAGVTVALLQGGTVIATTTTGASGDYSFTGLPAGTYAITVTDAYRVLLGYDVTVLGPTPGADNNNQAQPYTVVLGANQVNLTADFGYVTGPSGPQAAPNYRITKTRNGVAEVRPGSA